MSVFNNVLGIKIDPDLLKKIAQYASSYLLVNQILFYQILSSHKAQLYSPIDGKSLTTPYELSAYFDKVLDEDYQAIYSIDVARTLTQASLPKIRMALGVLQALAFDKFSADILGRVFHSLIPLEIRKVVAAYYTKEFAADILATYAVTAGSEKIVDLACGSGTLLVAAYKRKMFLLRTTQPNEQLHKNFVENEITGLDIMPFSAHLSTINLALQQPLAESNFVRVGIFDSTNAEPKTEIRPLREVVPLAQRQRIIEEFLNDGTIDTETVQEGAISLKNDPHSFQLEKVDAVIMNPPFTRQESISKIGTSYKHELVKKFQKKGEKYQCEIIVLHFLHSDCG
jgi:type I restriction-modification system DNA methylase subunit